ncbi:MAG: hypothetical protein HQL94_09615 [Magnetococcales bacterium]|nr:hypothetical protein [Magnetococcales bacterium]MBF0438760.1 hypothetical protein [Magnetococcales bacterium]
MNMGPKRGAALACLLLAGCATDKATQEKAVTENYMSYIGSNIKVITDKLGQPNMTMEVNVVGQRPAEGYLYYPKDGKGCISTFVVSEQTNEIINYFCR